MHRPMTIEDLLRMRWVSDPHLSSDGARVACIVTHVADPPKSTKKEEGKPARPDYVSHIYVIGLDSREDGATPNPVQFTAGRQRDATPRWSSDSRSIVFVSDRDRDGTAGEAKRRPRHVWLIPAAGGEARRLTVADHDPADPVWSPDGRWIAFVGKPPKRQEEEEKDVRVITRLKHKFDGEGFWDERFKHIYVVPAGGGEARQVTSGDFHHVDPAWSPDGRLLAFAANRSEDADSTNISDIWVVPIDSSDGSAAAEPRRLTRSAGPSAIPAWSPDGRRIAYVGHDNAFMTATSTQLWVVGIDGGDARNLTASFDRIVGHHLLTDMRAHIPTGRPAWTPDGRQIACVVGERGTTQLASVDAQTGDVRLLTQGNHEIFQFTVDAAVRRTVVAWTDPKTPGDLSRVDLGPTAPQAMTAWRRMTHLNQEMLDDVTLSEPEAFRYDGADGWSIEGWVLRPLGFDPARRYPTVLQIHGGPHSAYGCGFFHEFQVLAGEGFTVVYTNPRGSQGYGQTFAAATRHDWGGKDYEDIMRGLDAALARFPFLDPTRLGVAGGSYGGYMTNWVIGHTDRFKAAVTMRSIANTLSQWGMSDLAFMKGMWEFPGDPWENPAFYWERSPLAYANRITTPLLILHSEQDLRCPVGEAEQLFAALRKQGKEVVFLRFPEESHDMSRKGKPHRRVERLRWIVRWFVDHLGRVEEPDAERRAAGVEPAGARLAPDG